VDGTSALRGTATGNAVPATGTAVPATSTAVPAPRPPDPIAEAAPRDPLDDRPRHAAAARGARTGGGARLTVWLLHMAVPLLGLWMFLARPQTDVRWEHHAGHFGLVAGTAAVAVVLGLLVGAAARRRDDARLFLVALVFQLTAAFLGLHALATPGVVLDAPTPAFTAATPIGLLLGGIVAVVSGLEFTPARATQLVRRRRWLAALPWASVIGFAVLSESAATLLRPLVEQPDAAVTQVLFGIVTPALYLTAGALYLRVYRRRPRVVLLSVLTAFVLLAEASIAIVFGVSWQLSWWEWHLLMTLAFGFIAYSAWVQFRLEGSGGGLFDAVALDQTVTDLRQDYSAALEAMVDALHERETGGPGAPRPMRPVTARLAARFDVTERQLAVLERSAEALRYEREQARRLGALAEVGREARVIRTEDDLLTRVQAHTRHAFAHDDVWLELVRSGELTPLDDACTTSPQEKRRAAEAADRLETVASPDGRDLALPLVVKGRAAGVLRARRRHTAFPDADRALLTSFAGQVAIALENARLYHQLDGLFRSYMSPAVATSLIADPDQAELGGEIAEVTVLMADLRGFTSFSEQHAPDEVVAMLNTFFDVVVPVILEAGGTVVQFVGDEVMALFGAPTRQPDHAARAARAGLGLQEAVAAVSASRADWPRFGVGINTGPALVGNIGAEQMRNFTAIGDTTNLAARLQGLAQPGEVVVGQRTAEELGRRARLEARPPVLVKGRSEPLPTFLLRGLDAG
jgi:class 3 adenylate cyclase